MSQIIRVRGLESAIRPVEECHPISRSHTIKTLQADKISAFSEEQVSRAICVNNFWQTPSSLAQGETAHSKGASDRIEFGSFWAYVLNLSRGAEAAEPPKAEEPSKGLGQQGVAEPQPHLAIASLEVHLSTQGLASPERHFKEGHRSAACPLPSLAACPLGNCADEPLQKKQKSTLWPSNHPSASMTFPSTGSLEAMQELYFLIEQVGKGSYGRVFRARSDEHEHVAVKVIAGKSSCQEAYLQRYCMGPHVLPVLDAWTSPWYTVIVMPLLSFTLHQHMKQCAPLGDRCLINLVTQIAEGMLRLHDHGILHRDLHAGNVLMDGQGNAFLSDFGRAAFATGHDCRVCVYVA
jgi:hypothetical protein